MWPLPRSGAGSAALAPVGYAPARRSTGTLCVGRAPAGGATRSASGGCVRNIRDSRSVLERVDRVERLGRRRGRERDELAGAVEAEQRVGEVVRVADARRVPVGA